MYDDDQCVQCGGIRVSGSTLCVDCLVACVVDQKVLDGEMQKLRETLSRTQRSMRSVFAEFQKLQKTIADKKTGGEI